MARSKGLRRRALHRAGGWGGGLHRGGPSLVPPQHAHPQGPRAAPGGTLTCILTAITTEMSSFSSSLKTTSFFKVRLHNL